LREAIQGRILARRCASYAAAETETVHAREGRAEFIPAEAGTSVSAAPRAEGAATRRLWDTAWLECGIAEGWERQAGYQPWHLTLETLWR
jgi:hypothetical protein